MKKLKLPSLIFLILWSNVEDVMTHLKFHQCLIISLMGALLHYKGLTNEPLHPPFGQILEQLLLVRCILTAHEQGYMAHFSLIHRGFINSVLQKEDQANLPPTVRPRCSLKVASQRPINQCSFNLSDRNKKMKVRSPSQIDAVIRGYCFFSKCFLCPCITYYHFYALAKGVSFCF